MAITHSTTRFGTSCCWNCFSDPGGRTLLTVSEAASFCRVHRSTIYLWMRLNLIDWNQDQGGRRRIYQDSLTEQSPPAEPTHRSIPTEAP